MPNKEHEILVTLCKEAADKGITASFVLHKEKSHLMRIGNNSVSLNTSENLTRLDVEVINGRRTGSHTQMGDIVSAEYARKALQIAVDKAEVANEKDYQPIAVEIEENVKESRQYDPKLEALDPAFKAESYAQIIKECGEHYNFSGSWSSGSTELFMVSTANDKQVYHIGTDQDFNIVLKHPEKKWELRQNQTGWRQTDFSAEKVIKGLKDILGFYENETPYQPEPGEYKVAFGAEAVAEIMSMAAYLGFSGRAWEEKQGWTSKNQIGDKVLGQNFTLMDDPSCDRTYGFGFDLSGKVRRQFSLVENGVFKGLMYDASTAAKYGRKLTGHNIDSASLVMSTGTDSDNLLEAVKNEGRVLYIPALHYLNLPNYSQGIFTGSSRFNALLIEDGKIVGPIYSSRVTDTFKNVFANMIKVSSRSQSVNLSSTYDRRMPEAFSVPSYVVAGKVKITDSAKTF